MPYCCCLRLTVGTAPSNTASVQKKLTKGALFDSGIEVEFSSCSLAASILSNIPVLFVLSFVWLIVLNNYSRVVFSAGVVAFMSSVNVYLPR